MDKASELELLLIVLVRGRGSCIATISILATPFAENLSATTYFQVLDVVFLLELSESLPLLTSVILLNSCRACLRVAILRILLLRCLMNCLRFGWFQREVLINDHLFLNKTFLSILEQLKTGLLLQWAHNITNVLLMSFHRMWRR